MDKKKILLTIFIATILALMAVFFACKFFKSTPKEEVSVQKEEFEEIKSTNAQETAETKIEKSIQKTQPNIKKQSIKNSSPTIQKEALKTETIVKEIQVTENVEAVEETKDIVIPIEYTSKNTFKYVYTPARFTKRK